MDSILLQKYSAQWDLKSPQLLASTFTSEVYRVSFQNQNAVLKMLTEKGKEFESRGALVLRCFDGKGAVRLLQSDDGAHLLEFVDGPILKSLVVAGQDLRATEIICDVLEKLHNYSGPVPPELIGMSENFRVLLTMAKTEPLDSIFVQGARRIEKMLSDEQEIKVLHGDLHHENILESSSRGWLVIDPQCLAGERTYDVANIFYNPEGLPDFAASEETIRQRCDIFAKSLGLDKKRILEYAFAYGCLSASWFLQDGMAKQADETLRIVHSVHRVLQSLD